MRDATLRARTLQALRYAVLIALGVLFALPFVWMVGTSLTPAADVLDRNRPMLPPHPVWGNYSEALVGSKLPFDIFLKNTLLISVLCMIGQTTSAASVAFAFARLRFPYRDKLFLLVLSTLMLPSQVTMIPTFVMWATLGYIDSLKPLIIPSFFGGGAFFIFLLRQFFLTIPAELEDAARIDGCTNWQIFRHVAIPLARPALITVALFSFIGNWNDFLHPLIYTQSTENKTLALGLTAFKSLFGTEYHLLMAASVAVLLPILIIFFCAQRYFVEGLSAGAVKG